MAGELASLVSNPFSLATLNDGITRAVAQSFREDKFRPTMSEIRRRFNMCVDIFKMLHAKPFEWSVIRIVDEMGHGLRHKLDGIPWDPTKARSLYVPGPGAYQRFMR
jgi:hypothetical protein